MAMKVLPVVRERGVCCGLPDVEERWAEETATLMKALADPTRLTMMASLWKAKTPICICDFTASLDLTQPTISHHMGKLKEAWDLDLLPVGVDPRAGEATATEPADRLSGGSRYQFADELLDADVDLVPDSAHRVQILARRIVQLPVFISFARIDRAGVTAAHRYHHVGRLDVIVRQRFWKLSADIQADLAHRLDHARIQRACRLATGRSDVYATCGVTLEKCRRHLADPRCARTRREPLGCWCSSAASLRVAARLHLREVLVGEDHVSLARECARPQRPAGGEREVIAGCIRDEH